MSQIVVSFKKRNSFYRELQSQTLKNGIQYFPLKGNGHGSQLLNQIKKMRIWYS